MLLENIISRRQLCIWTLSLLILFSLEFNSISESLLSFMKLSHYFDMTQMETVVPKFSENKKKTLLHKPLILTNLETVSEYVRIHNDVLIVNTAHRSSLITFLPSHEPELPTDMLLLIQYTAG